MANNIAFQPMGETFYLSVDDTASFVAVEADSPVNQYRLHNAGDEVVFVRIANSDDEDAEEPVDETPAYGMPVGPHETEVITGPQCSPIKTVYLSAISGGNASVIYVTPGEGV